MSFPRYPKYKDSGVEWLGEVPEHWESSRVRWLCSRFSGGTPDKSKVEYWENGSIPWLNSGAVNDRVITEPSEWITPAALEYSSAKWIPRDALLIALAGQGKTKGMVAQLKFEATCNQSMAALITGRQIKPRFLFWWLDSNYQNIRNMAGGDLRDGLNLELLGDIPCPLPAIAEQHAIASFLDRETAKIDALIAEQQRLIELLQEKRQAVISHVVTKGLNPDAPMKDSGIEWLGEVPAHWKVGKCGFYVTLLSGFAFPSQGFTTNESDWKLLRGVNVGVNSIRWDEVAYWPRSEGDGLDRFELQIGDLVMGMDRPLIADGMRVARISQQDLPSLLLQRVLKIVPDNDIDIEYLRQLLSSDFFVAHFAPETTGVSVPHISPEQVSTFVIPVPPFSEQAEIVDQISNFEQHVAGLERETRRGVELLQERRSALISAAVTGQIDVRGLAPKEAA